MINNFKLKTIIPFSLSAICLALSACGGESATINEDPNAGIKTSTNGCDWGEEKCQGFVVSYPISGLNFDCQSDPNNHFEVLREGNIFTGGCLVKDKVHFYIQGDNSSRRIDLGVVDLAKLSPLRVEAQPAEISLLDIAVGMTGKPASSMNMNDETYKIMVGLVRLFQAIAIDNGVSKSEVDVQPVELRLDQKNGLNVLASNVGAQDFIDGSYLTDLAPWLNINNKISETSALTVAEQLVNLKNVSIYSANFLAIQADNVDIGGFNGVSDSNSSKKTIANLYLLTDRQGHSTGYTVQWTGIPPASATTGSEIATINGRVNLLTQVAPIKSNLDSGKAEVSVKDWINPLSNQIKNPLTFKTGLNTTDTLNIFQGNLLSQKSIAGNAYAYKRVMGGDIAPENTSPIYGRWNQSLNGENFKGAIDLTRTNPATYLGNDVFKTVNTVRASERYIFPLYATLRFSFTNSSDAPVEVGIVIDQNGDIRSNRTATSLAASSCSTVNEELLDSNGIQQYRIGTTGATNYTVTDKSITIRMILAHKDFGKLDGAIVGFNSNFATLPSNQSNSLTVDVVTSGARINLKRLIDDGIHADALNISDWKSDTAIVKWDNLHAVSQRIYNLANASTATPEQINLAKLDQGRIEQIKLLPCSTYAIK